MVQVLVKDQQVELLVEEMQVLINGNPIHMNQIQSQQIKTVKASGKVLLKLVLKGGTSVIFSFTGPKAEEERESIKHAIAVGLGKLQEKPNTDDIEAKRQLLSKDQTLERMHKDLVRSGILSEEDFWNTRLDKLQYQQWQQSQKKGMISASLADIKPADTDDSQLKYTLNPDIIHSIFIQYPSVNKAYIDLVPHKMTEKEFWVQYFSSKHFHRNRVSLDEDIFTPYVKEDENDKLLDLKLQYDPNNKLLDLTTTMEDHGNRPDQTMRAGGVKSSLPLIRKFNRHSEAVLAKTVGPKTKKVKSAKESDDVFMQETFIDDLKPKEEPQLLPLVIPDAHSYFGTNQQKQQQQQIKQTRLEDLISEKEILRLTELSRMEKLRLFGQPNLDKLKECVECALELLRHFWSSNVTNKRTQIQEALQKMHTTMTVIEKSQANEQAKQVLEGYSLATKQSIEWAIKQK
ncbi:BSD domain-containing protein [Gorgonomyces haynaldii]|nr:BSD domain-containing protein [Gorgonomyces haynaldii]